jgi:nitrate reductase NapD
MNISSAIVHAIPGRADSIRSQLAALPGVEIHAQAPDGRFVVTVEDVPGAKVADTVMALHRIDGVRFAALVYQYADEAPPPEAAK